MATARSAPVKGRRLKILSATFAGLGTYMGYTKFTEAIEVVKNPADVDNLGALFALRLVFGRTRSRLMGSLMNVEIPLALRSSLFSAFAWLYSADLAETRYPIESYKTFQEFFERSLAPGARTIQSTKPSTLTSPCDGEVLTVGDLSEGAARIPQVKGATYNLKAFLGVDPFKHKAKDSVLKYCVIYLAPGDYHRFHSPTNFHAQQGRHFSGEVLPVSKQLVSWFDNLFALNERVVLSGTWALGQMHYGIVAAYNVGNIVLSFDEKLKTNDFRALPVYRGGEIRTKSFDEKFSHGDWVGSFKLGSTIVLIFEASNESQWKVDVGSKVKMGQVILS